MIQNKKKNIDENSRHMGRKKTKKKYEHSDRFSFSNWKIEKLTKQNYYFLCYDCAVKIIN